ncbi:DUF6083 domain-containing protein [Streptomyces monashensis]|uniref:DUF6083 domain-containing protein n=1 Tax=Streptomyces monashensis TaxID=1678012 RepID=UPI0033EF7A2F
MTATRPPAHHPPDPPQPQPDPPLRRITRTGETPPNNRSTPRSLVRSCCADRTTSVKAVTAHRRGTWHGHRHAPAHSPRWSTLDGSLRYLPYRRTLRIAEDGPNRLLRAGQTGRCRHCGNRIDRYERFDGRLIDLHPAEVATTDISAPCRWHIGSGIAYPHDDGSGWCRIATRVARSHGTLTACRNLLCTLQPDEPSRPRACVGCPHDRPLHSNHQPGDRRGRDRSPFHPCRSGVPGAGSPHYCEPSAAPHS